MAPKRNDPARGRIALIGGGIGGLAAALALTRRGFRPRVYEQSSEIKEIGAGIQVTPNSAKVLRALGLEEELKSWAFEPQTMVTRDSITGREVSRSRRWARMRLSSARAGISCIAPTCSTCSLAPYRRVLSKPTAVALVLRPRTGAPSCPSPTARGMRSMLSSAATAFTQPCATLWRGRSALYRSYVLARAGEAKLMIVSQTISTLASRLEIAALADPELEVQELRERVKRADAWWPLCARI